MKPEGSLRLIKTVIFTQYSSLLPKILKLLGSGTLNYLIFQVLCLLCGNSFKHLKEEKIKSVFK